MMTSAAAAASSSVVDVIDSIFIGTFNSNNAKISSQDASTWLAQAREADLIVLTLQEAPSCNNDSQSEYCRISESNKDEMLITIENEMGNEYRIVADVAMGEPATGKKEMICSSDGRQEMVEWYGYIRIICFAKSSLADRLLQKTLVCPVGSKLSWPEYPVGSSPDKGAVGVMLNDLLLCSVHLCGTNKYNTKEEVFDVERKRQLQQISQAVEWSDIGYSIVAGDFNFRCEVLPEEKSRGGGDFQAVRDQLKSNNASDVKKLFDTHDRLKQFMSKKNELPMLLKDTSDVFCHAFDKGQYVLPTFTFEMSTNDKNRPYSDKRTPSWTDRVLVSDRLLQAFEIIAVGTVPEVTISDHIPVFCRLDKKRNMKPCT